MAELGVQAGAAGDTGFERITPADMADRAASIMSATGLLITDLRAIVIDYLRDTRGIDMLRELADQSAKATFYTRVACDAGAIMRARLLPDGAHIGRRIGHVQVSFAMECAWANQSSIVIAHMSLEEAWSFICGEPCGQMMELVQVARISARWRELLLDEMRCTMAGVLSKESLRRYCRKN